MAKGVLTILLANTTATYYLSLHSINALNQISFLVFDFRLTT